MVVLNPWITEVLVLGIDDWIQPGDILGVARRSGLTDGVGLRSLWIGIVSEAICFGQLDVGEVRSGEFVPWGTSFAESMALLIQAIDRIGILNLGLGDICWFRATELGISSAHHAISAGWESLD